MRLHPLLIAAAILASPCVLRAADTPADVYPIQLQRDFAAGQNFDLHMVVDESTDITGAVMGQKGEPKTESTHTKTDLSARIQVVDRDPKENTLTLIVTVKHLLNTAGRDCMPPGKIIDVFETADDCKMTPHTPGSIPDNAKPLLKKFFGRTRPQKISSDDVFGTPDPKKIGESWNVNSVAAADFFSQDSIRLLPNGIVGQTTLAGVEKNDGPPALRLATTITGKDFTSDLVPKRIMIESSNFTLTSKRLLPTDTTQLYRDLDETLDATAKASTVSSLLKIDLKLHTSFKGTITPVTATASK